MSSVSPSSHGPASSPTSSEPRLAPALAAADPVPTPTPLATSPPSFYKRQLPPTCIDYASTQGKELFKMALNEGNMESYFRLASQFTTQSEPAYCGLGTLCMVLNALGVDPQRQWKGPWRWFEDSMLDCCRPLEEVKKSGITLSEFGCLAVCNGLTAQVNRADIVSQSHFLRDIQRTSTQDDKVLCVSYHRGTLGQTGSGHFSPIAGYCAERNMVLLMDVARFKYPPHWVSVDLLWSALLPHDSETGKPRGYVILNRQDLDSSSSSSSSLLCTPLPKLALDASTIATLMLTLRALPPSLAAHRPTGVDHALQVILAAVPPQLLGMVQERTVEDLAGNVAVPAAVACADRKCQDAAAQGGDMSGGQREEESSGERAAALTAFRDTYRRQLALLLTRVRDTHAFAHVAAALAALGANYEARDPALVTLLLLSLPLAPIVTGAAEVAALPEPLLGELRHLWSLDTVPPLVKHEVQGLRGQIEALLRTWCEECGMTREDGERAGKCAKKRTGSPAEADRQTKRVRGEGGEAVGLVFAPSPSPPPQEANKTEGCCWKSKDSGNAPGPCKCCRGGDKDK